MTIQNLFNQFLDLTILFSFDRSGFLRHCPEPLKSRDLSGRHGIVTGASSGIGFEVAKSLMQQKMDVELIGRNLEKLENAFRSIACDPYAHYHSLDMANLNKVYAFAKNTIKAPVDLLIHNAGDMPLSLKVTDAGFEQMFASQVLAPFILTKTLAELGKLNPGCRVVFVSSGGMYLQKLDLSDLLFVKNPYNKYTGYANAKRAQVILAELFSKKYPEYLFSSMHPGWADTPGVSHSLPIFKKLLDNRLRSAQEGADTILWLATADNYPNGKFWFDRKEAKTTILNFYKTTEEENGALWTYCESIFHQVEPRNGSSTC